MNLGIIESKCPLNISFFFYENHTFYDKINKQIYIIHSTINDSIVIVWILIVHMHLLLSCVFSICIYTLRKWSVEFNCLIFKILYFVSSYNNIIL